MELEMAFVAALERVDGLSGRVCPVIDIQKSTGPLVVYDPRQESEERVVDGTCEFWTAMIQVHVLHNTYEKMRQLAKRVRDASRAMEGLVEGPLRIEAVVVELGSPDLFEGKADLFRRTYNVSFYYQIKEE